MRFRGIRVRERCVKKRVRMFWHSCGLEETNETIRREGRDRHDLERTDQSRSEMANVQTGRKWSSSRSVGQRRGWHAKRRRAKKKGGRLRATVIQVMGRWKSLPRDPGEREDACRRRSSHMINTHNEVSVTKATISAAVTLPARRGFAAAMLNLAFLWRNSFKACCGVSIFLLFIVVVLDTSATISLLFSSWNTKKNGLLQNYNISALYVCKDVTGNDRKFGRLIFN